VNGFARFWFRRAAMSHRWLFRLLASTHTATDHVTDAELLRRFISSNDSAAFELIVRRHADAVWAACRRLLRTDADAEDAFQATFLALVRKARTIRNPCLGGWLYRVAVNAARLLRRRAARSVPVSPVQFAAVAAPRDEPPDAVLATAVHEELAQLPEHERLPVVLCDLEGLSHADAAKALGWPLGTVAGRLSRARARLRARLERRGLAPSAALFPALVAPPHLIPNAVLLTTGTVSPAIVSLTEGVLAMTTTTWKWVAVAVACSGVLGAGAVLALGPGAEPAPRPNVVAPERGAARNDPAPAKEDPVGGDWTPKHLGNEIPTVFPNIKPPGGSIAEVCPRLTGKKPVVVAPTDTTELRLLKARIHQCCLALTVWMENAPAYPAFREVLQCQAELLSALRELWPNDPEKLAPWLEETLIVAKSSEHRAREILTREKDPRILEGRGLNSLTLSALTRHRLAVETALWRATKGK
jgi:RNA polymerase sigma factor (sigma-70 family)